MTSGRLFARNSAINLAGILLPLVVAVLAMPPLIRGFGAERFGILTLIWAAIGYFGLFELGLSRALTQAVAQRLGAGRLDELPAVAWTALTLLAVLGVLGGLAVLLATDVMVHRVLNVPERLQREAALSFRILAASLPFVVSTAGLRGLMEAHRHFGMANALRAPLLAFMFAGPLLSLAFSDSLVPAVAVLAAGRAVGWAAYLAVCLKQYTYLRPGARVSRSALGPLLRYGGWTTVTNAVSPMMVYLDRFLVGALLPIAAVAHYVTPYEVITKFLFVPVAILGAMFPDFAGTFATDRERMGRLYDRSLRAVVLTTFPVLLVAVALAPEGMRLWMGTALPPESTAILQWLAVGIFINGLAQAPFAALQGAGRPDLIAKLHLLELPIYVASIVLLVRSMGLVGVAIAWSLRVTLDAALLMLVTQRTIGLEPTAAGTRPWAVAVMLAALALAALPLPLPVRALYAAAVVTAFAAAAWRQLLTPSERRSLVAWLRSGRGAPVPASEELA